MQYFYRPDVRNRIRSIKILLHNPILGNKNWETVQHAHMNGTMNAKSMMMMMMHVTIGRHQQVLTVLTIMSLALHDALHREVISNYGITATLLVIALHHY